MLVSIHMLMFHISLQLGWCAMLFYAYCDRLQKKQKTVFKNVSQSLSVLLLASILCLWLIIIQTWYERCCDLTPLC